MTAHTLPLPCLFSDPSIFYCFILTKPPEKTHQIFQAAPSIHTTNLQPLFFLIFMFIFIDYNFSFILNTIYSFKTHLSLPIIQLNSHISLLSSLNVFPPLIFFSIHKSIILPLSIHTYKFSYNP